MIARYTFGRLLLMSASGLFWVSVRLRWAAFWMLDLERLIVFERMLLEASERMRHDDE